MTVTVLPAATSEDGHTVEVSAEGVVDGSTWRIQVGWADSGQERTFRRAADDERWALSTHVGAPESEETFLEVWAESGSGWCFAGLHSVGSSAAFGLGACGNGLHGLLVQRRDEVTVAALAFVLAVAPDRTRWHLDLAAKGVDERQSVAFDDYSNRWAELVSGVELVGAPLEPRFALAAESRKTGKTCRIRLNPAVLTVSAEERLSVPRMVLQPRRR